MTKKTAHVKKSFDLFLLYLYNRIFLVLRSSTKGAAQLPNYKMLPPLMDIWKNISGVVCQY